MKSVTVVDYGRGNLFSLGRALDQLGVDHAVSDDAAQIRAAECLILPGVGAFGDAMRGLAARDLVEPLRAAAKDGVPLLGICLGMQVLVSRGLEFGEHQGLGLIPGVVRRLPEDDGGRDAVRIPNVGWRPIRPIAGDSFLGDLAAGTMFYFVHSYAPVLDDPRHAIATINVNGMDMAAIIRRENVVGCQFHPEKSGPEGLSFLHGFVEFAISRRRAA